MLQHGNCTSKCCHLVVHFSYCMNIPLRTLHRGKFYCSKRHTLSLSAQSSRCSSAVALCFLGNLCALKPPNPLCFILHTACFPPFGVQTCGFSFLDIYRPGSRSHHTCLAFMYKITQIPFLPCHTWYKPTQNKYLVIHFLSFLFSLLFETGSLWVALTAMKLTL